MLLTKISFSNTASAVVFAVSVAGLMPGRMVSQTNVASQANPAASITTNHAVTEADGTVRMQRVVPLPVGLSPEARAWLSRPAGDADVPQTMEQRRQMLDTSQAKHRDDLLKMFAVDIKEGTTVGGVPVRDVLPKKMEHAIAC